MTFKEAKAEANRIGGVVTWWCSYSVHSAEDYSYATCGFPKYISKQAEQFYKKRYENQRKS